MGSSPGGNDNWLFLTSFDTSRDDDGLNMVYMRKKNIRKAARARTLVGRLSAIPAATEFEVGRCGMEKIGSA